MSKLLPCPFCGGEAEYYTYEQEHDLYDSNTLGFLETYETTEHYVGCKECLAMVGTFVTKKQAVKAWNTRAERTCHFDQTDKIPTTSGMIRVWECSNCGRECEELNGVYEYCPHCKAKVVE